MKFEDERLDVQRAVAATPSMHGEWAVPAAEAVEHSGDPKRKRRLTEAQRLAPFSWDAGAVAPGPAFMCQFQLAAEPAAQGDKKRSRAPSMGATPGAPPPGTRDAVVVRLRRLQATPASPVPYSRYSDAHDDHAFALFGGSATPVPSSACFGEDYAPEADDAGTALAAAPQLPRRQRKRAKKAAAAPASGVAKDARLAEAASRKSAKAALKAGIAAAEAARAERLAAAEARAAAAAPRRDAALARHLDVLRPFVPADVAARLEAAAAAAAHAEAGRARAPKPAELLATLQPHQERGFRWLTTCYTEGLHPLLGDDMGLGKTLQAISLLAHATFGRDGAGGPHLVVCPLSVLPGWQAELARWCPALRVRCARAGGGADDKARLAAELCDFASYDVALTTYDAMLTDGALGAALRGSRVCWDVLVLDEAHRAKNECGALGKALRGVRRACTLLMSGTLLQNNLHELWALLNLAYPSVFTDPTPFDAAFRLDGDAAGADEAALQAAHALLKALCLRREKAEVARSLPPRTEVMVHCPMAPRQVALYRNALRRSVAAVDGNGDTRTLKSLCMELRLICGHPRLIELDDDDSGDGDSDDDAQAADDSALEALLSASGKLAVLDRVLTSLKAGGHRVVLFSQFNTMLDILARLLRLRGHAYARLDGGVNPARRAVDIMRFNAAGSKLFVFLSTTKCGGVGINLQSADTVILYDSDWNPQSDEQAMARCHRIGQTRPVHVLRLVTSRSVEERIVTRAEKKLYLDAVVAKGDASLWSAADIRHGADSLFSDVQEAPPNDAQLAALCDRSAAATALRAEAAEKAAASAAAASVELSLPPPPLRAALPPEEVDAARAEAAAAAAARAAEEAELPRSARRKALREAARRRAAPPPPAAAAPRRRQIAGVDYNHMSHCLACWDGGDLVCCDACPAAYHADCLGLDANELASLRRWSCPHHTCKADGCGRNHAQAGGLLFRCEACPDAYCAQHLPEEVLACGRLVEECDRFKRMGQVPPSTALFIHCSEDCASWAAQNFGLSADDVAQLAPPRPAWVCDGDDDLALPAGVSLRHAKFGQLKAFLMLLRDPARKLSDAEHLRPLRNMLASDGDQAFAALYAAAREAMLRGDKPREAETVERAALSGDDDDAASDDEDEDARADASEGSASSSSDSDGDLADLDPEGPVRGRAQGCGRRPRTAWTAEESAALRAAVQACGTRWQAVHADAIARGVNPTRTVNDVQTRWYRQRDTERPVAAALAQQQEQAAGASEMPAQLAMADPSIRVLQAAAAGRRRRIHWSASESAALTSLVAEHGEGNWRVIRDTGVATGRILALRTPNDVRQRWLVMQQPKECWTVEEERLLVQLVKRHGAGNWIQIRFDPEAAGTLLASRTGQQIRVKWRTMRKYHPEFQMQPQPAGAAMQDEERMAMDEGEEDESEDEEWHEAPMEAEAEAGEAPQAVQ